MTPKLILFLAIGTVAMGIPMFLTAKKYTIPGWKALLTTVLLTVSGTAGTFLMYFVENGRFGGLSFFGAVFLVPVVFLAAAPMLRVPYGPIMDLCAIGECIMLALMKVHCILGGCCLGRVLFTTDADEIIRFPSRTAELITALVLFGVLFRWGLKKQHTEELYARYLLLYGGSRFMLNILREAWVVKQMLLPFGNIWSLIAMAIGGVWLMVLRKRTIQQEKDTSGETEEL